MERLYEMPPDTLNATMALAIAVGTLYCFLGYRALRFVLGFTGFGLAGGTAAALAGWLSGYHLVVMAVAGALGGLCGAMALFFLFRLGIFFLGLLGTLVVALQVFQDRPEPWAAWAIVAVAVLGGLVAVLLQRPVITLATAVLGGWITVAGIAYFMRGLEFVERIAGGGGRALTEEHLVALAVWLVLTVFGAFTQFATHRPSAKKEVVREVRVVER